MNRFVFAASVLTLCASSIAQTYVTSPAGFLSTEGARYAYMLGRYADARYMTLDGEYRGKLMIMKEMAFRLDDRTHYSYTAQGRTWKNVKLHMGECDYTTLSQLNSVFSLNITNTPTKVFDTSMSWPAKTGKPSTSPAPWSIKFPFSTSYIHVGTKDIAADFRFSGGTLANNAAWSSTRSYSYYMDSKNSSSYGYNTQKYHGPYSTTGGCRDSASSRTYGAYNYFYFYHYGPNYGVTSYRNKFRIYQYSYYTGPNAPVMHAISLLGSATGTNFPGVTCQKLYINPAGIAILAGKTASATGYSGQIFPTGTPNGIIPVLKSAIGLKLWTQATWSDTKTKATKFTRAVETVVPDVLPPTKHAMVYQYQKVLQDWWGYGPYDYYYYTPIRRYTK